VELRGRQCDWALFKSQKWYIKRDIKSLLSVSLAAMDQHSTSSISIPMYISLDVCVDGGVSDDAEDDCYGYVSIRT
jgi:hypothetical protein